MNNAFTVFETVVQFDGLIGYQQNSTFGSPGLTQSVQLDVICMFCDHNCRSRFETSLQIFNFVNISANNRNAMFVLKSNQKFTQSLVSVSLVCYELNIALNLKSNGRLIIGSKQSDRNVLDFFVKPSDISSPFLREDNRLKSHWIVATAYLFLFIVINSALFP